jgi:ATP-dependent helicase/nuclease subunit A
MSYFLTKEGDPRGNTAFVNERLLRERPELLPPFLAEADRILAVEARRRDLRALELSDALASLGAPLLAGYAEAKARNDALDYDDLIARAEQLLHEPGAGWILYKLDGGLDHLLLDEVQDTAPAQWRIAGALTAEFFAGEGPSRAPRTVFAVGDRKQSIFRFQGADPSAFDDWRARLPQRVRAAGKVWRDEELNVSFRSTEPVLHLVDAVFADPVAARGVLAPDETLHHIADRAEDAGCVEVWPLLDADRKEAVEPWPVARENRSARDARQHLADHLADWIKARTSGTELLESQGRALQPGDVMVLVRSRRNGFAERLTRALKARGVKVGGLDRMVLTEQQAVRDLVTLGEALLLPDDDLSFAAFLVSPLGGVSHASLEDLALSRAGSLRQELQRRAGERADWRAAEDFFAALLARVDFCAPFQLYSEALGALGGRARLLARLGAEAEEPIGEFLNASLSYARLHPPSLQGFLHWLCRSGAEIKREQEEAGDAVRIMTVHGAKGLQAPLVILPDTTALPPDEAGLLSARLEEMEIPILAPNRDARGAAVAALQNARRAAEMEEYNRLLYVALTRAADRLLVCGWKGRHEVPEQSWYNRIRAGIERLSPTRVTFDAWPGEVLRLETPQRRAPRKAPAEPQAAPPPPPAWLGQAPDWHASPPPAEPSLPEPLAPSRPEGVELGSVPPAASPLGERVPAGRRFQRGQWVHALLQHLPGLPATRRRAAAVSWLRRPGIGLAPAAAAELADEVMAILEHPELADLFGPHGQAEVPLTGVVAERVVGGLVDRLAVLPERVILADYKTNRDPPRTAEATPVMYLRQMAAYRALLAAIFPDRPIRCVLVWTRASLPVMLPDALLDAHAPGLPLAAAAGTPA